MFRGIKRDVALPIARGGAGLLAKFFRAGCNITNRKAKSLRQGSHARSAPFLLGCVIWRGASEAAASSRASADALRDRTN
eukprot:2434189-Pyramimonas_sp.AAC.1